MAAANLRINGAIYGWSSVTVNILGVSVVGIQGIEYKDTEETDPVYGAGKAPVGVGVGNVKFEGKITLLMNEVEALIKVSTTGRLQDIPLFDITVSYLQGTAVMTHKLRGCKFTENAVNVKQGDKMIAVECPLFISFIEWK